MKSLRSFICDHVIRIQPGTNSVKAFNGTAFAYNVRLEIVAGLSLAVMREKEIEGSLEPVVVLCRRGPFAASAAQHA